jgi:hypothetical protein
VDNRPLTLRQAYFARRKIAPIRMGRMALRKKKARQCRAFLKVLIVSDQ